MSVSLTSPPASLNRYDKDEHSGEGSACRSSCSVDGTSRGSNDATLSDDPEPEKRVGVRMGQNNPGISGSSLFPPQADLDGVVSGREDC